MVCKRTSAWTIFFFDDLDIKFKRHSHHDNKDDGHRNGSQSIRGHRVFFTAARIHNCRPGDSMQNDRPRSRHGECRARYDGRQNNGAC